MLNAIARSALACAIASASIARADMTCTATTRAGHTLTLTVDSKAHSAQVKVVASNGVTLLQEAFPEIKDVWDGHSSGLITANGLSVKYSNHFGCFRNVAITTLTELHGLMETVTVPLCKNGNPRGDLCRPAGR